MDYQQAPTTPLGRVRIMRMLYTLLLRSPVALLLYSVACQVSQMLLAGYEERASSHRKKAH